MKKFLVIAAVTLASVLAVLVGVLVYIVLSYPHAGPVPSLVIHATPGRIARGA